MAISLANLQRGKRIRAPKIVVYGGPKIGKSTFASKIPDAIFIQTEEGLDALDVTAFPLATKFQEVLDALHVLATEKHDFKAVVLDSADWTEALIWQHLCDANKVDSIEKVGGGYGKGYIEAVKLLREMLERFDYLRNERGMAVVLIAHDEVQRMMPPDGEPYDYAALKLHKRAAAVIEEWADCIGYVVEKTATKKDDIGFNKKHVRAISLNERVLHVGNNAAYVSGNRYGIEGAVPLDWNAFVQAMTDATQPPAQTQPESQPAAAAA